MPGEKTCRSLDDAGCRQGGKKLGIPFEVIDMRAEFKERVIDLLREYAAGRTPNPCIRCNDLIKFGLLLKKAKDMGRPAGNRPLCPHIRG